MVKSARILIAVMFILSAIAKLLSLEFFDQLVAEVFFGKAYYEHIDSLFYTQLLARVLIVGELVLGMAVLQNHLLKKLVLPLIMAMFVVFTAHLTYAGIQTKFIGGNCGCFGDIIPLDNFESIVKNILGMLLVAFVYYKHTDRQSFESWVPPVALGLVTFGVLWLTIRDFDKPVLSEEVNVEISGVKDIPVLNVDTLETVVDSTKEVLDLEGINDENKEVIITELAQKEQIAAPIIIDDSPVVNEFSLLLDKYTDFTGKSNVKLNKGHKLVCIYSLTCSHCQQAYKELYQLDKSGKLPEMYLICYGKEFDKFYFFNQGGGEKPHILVTDKHEFDILMQGESFPKILDMQDGKILQKWDIASYEKQKVADYFNVTIDKATKVDDPSSITIEEEVFDPFK